MLANTKQYNSWCAYQSPGCVFNGTEKHLLLCWRLLRRAAGPEKWGMFYGLPCALTDHISKTRIRNYAQKQGAEPGSRGMDLWPDLAHWKDFKLFPGNNKRSWFIKKYSAIIRYFCLRESISNISRWTKLTVKSTCFKNYAANVNLSGSKLIQIALADLIRSGCVISI